MSSSPHETTPKSIDLDRYDAIIFDLGGVILPLDYRKTVQALSQLFNTDAGLAYSQRKQKALFDRFERGEIESSVFRQELSRLFDVDSKGEPPPDEKIDAAWNALLLIIPQDTLLFLARLKGVKRTFLLSNTNEIHITKFLSDYRTRHEQSHGSWAALFEYVHYSHRMGARKPEPRIYQHLIEIHGLQGDRTLFLDDNKDNVRGALDVGLNAEFHPTNLPLTHRFEESQLIGHDFNDRFMKD